MFRPRHTPVGVERSVDITLAAFGLKESIGGDDHWHPLITTEQMYSGAYAMLQFGQNYFIGPRGASRSRETIRAGRHGGESSHGRARDGQRGEGELTPASPKRARRPRRMRGFEAPAGQRAGQPAARESREADRPRRLLPTSPGRIAAVSRRRGSSCHSSCFSWSCRRSRRRWTSTPRRSRRASAVPDPLLHPSLTSILPANVDRQLPPLE